MDEVYNEAKRFINIIKNTEIYNDYIKSKKIIESKPKLNEKLNDFRKSSFEIQLSSNYGQYNCYEQLLNLKKANDDLLNNVFAKEFLEDELKMTKMIRTIFNTMIEELDFDIEFLD